MRWPWTPCPEPPIEIATPTPPAPKPPVAKPLPPDYRPCPKCGFRGVGKFIGDSYYGYTVYGPTATLVYDAMENVLKLVCTHCTYSRSVPPVDAEGA